MQLSPQVRSIAFVGDYYPRKCGIATFTHDLRLAVTTVSNGPEVSVVSVNDVAGAYDYGPEVLFEIEESDVASYLRAADFINLQGVDVVCLQHEYGIFGGRDGSHILALLGDLKAPIVTTLHTVLEEPSKGQKRVLQQLAQLSSRLVVMTQETEECLHEVYQVPRDRIDLIAHGIPDVPQGNADFFKRQFGVQGKTVLLTFGLLSPGKGIEHVIKALPEIVAACPETVYIILGATHPHLLRDQGEAYRLSLQRLCKDQGVQKNVIFFDLFVELEQLKQFIAAADIYITPYLNAAQAVSGTLAYAFGSGKAVVSTPYGHARELLAEDRGVLVPFADSEALSREVVALLRDDARRQAMQEQAYALGRKMLWSEVGMQYVQSFERARKDLSRSSRMSAARTLDQESGHLPAFKLDHLERMSDSTGLFQHATFTVPNWTEGYCTDDNARGLLLTVLLQELGVSRVQLDPLSTAYAAFLNYAYDSSCGEFHNFMGFARNWLDLPNSQDSHGRALWALGACVGRASRHQDLARSLFDRALPTVAGFTSPRACASSLLGIHEYMARLGGDRVVQPFREMLTERIMDGYRATSRPEWDWFEENLSYDNARLSQALIVSGRETAQRDVLDAGLASLTWLMEQQTARAGHFRPIGSNHPYVCGQERPCHDQQPLEAQATVSACLEAFRSTGHKEWHAHAFRAFEWFLGRNDLGLPLYDPTSGGCKDGLHADRTNENQGAESTLAYLLALAELRLSHNELTSFRETLC